MTRCFRVVDLRVSIFIFHVPVELTPPSRQLSDLQRPSRVLHYIRLCLFELLSFHFYNNIHALLSRTLARYLRSVQDALPVAKGSASVGSDSWSVVSALTHPYRLESSHYRELAPTRPINLHDSNLAIRQRLWYSSKPHASMYHAWVESRVEYLCQIPIPRTPSSCSGLLRALVLTDKHVTLNGGGREL